MPNKRYSEFSTDSASKESSGGPGKKNVDGREDGEKYNSQNKADFNPKETYSPNDDSPQLPQRGGLEDGAY